MGDEKSTRVLVRRPSKTKSTGRGRGTRANSGAGTELELVSTQILKQILSSNDAANRQGVEEAAKATGEGVLARDPATGYFEIIDDDELQAIVDSGQDLPKLSRPADVTVVPLHDYADNEHLSLVSIQALRRVLDGGDEKEEVEAADVGGFNPYQS